MMILVNFRHLISNDALVYSAKPCDLILDMLQATQPSQPMPGQKPKLTCGEQLLVALEYWREYRTYFHIACDWGISEL